MEEFETALIQKSWVPDPNREKYTVYAGQLQEESIFPLQAVIITSIVVLAGAVTIVIFRNLS